MVGTQLHLKAILSLPTRAHHHSCNSIVSILHLMSLIMTLKYNHLKNQHPEKTRPSCGYFFPRTTLDDVPYARHCLGALFVPALLMRMCILGSVSLRISAVSLMDCKEARSRWWTTTELPVSWWISSAATLAFWRSRHSITTRAPATVREGEAEWVSWQH